MFSGEVIGSDGTMELQAMSGHVESDLVARDGIVTLQDIDEQKECSEMDPWRTLEMTIQV